MYATPVCEMSACGFRCNDGFAREGAECVPLAPALLSPLSSWTTNEANPEFRTSTSAAFVEYRNEVCRDRACTQRVAQWTATTGASRCPSPITPGIIAYWRSTGVMRDGRTKASAIVPFRTTRRATRGYDTPFFDFDGDGLSDALANHGELFRPASNVLFGARSVPSDAAQLPIIPLPPPRREEMIWTQSHQTIGDFDGDGFGDAVMVTTRAQLHFGSAPRGGRDVATSDIELNAAARLVIDARVIAPIGDFNDDGLSDFVVTSWNHVTRAHEFHLFLGRADRELRSSFTSRGVTALQIVAGPECPHPVLGKSRILYAVGALSLQSTPRFAIAVRVRANGVEPVLGDVLVPFAEAVVEDVGDIDGDGRNEAIMRSMGRSDQVILMRMDADCSRLETTTHTFPATIAVARTTDLDGNGTHELVVARRATRAEPEFISVYRGGANVLMDRVGTASLAPATLDDGTIDGPTRFANFTFGSTGDMNGDGLDDFIVGSPTQSLRAIYFTGNDLTAWPAAGTEIAVPFVTWSVASRAAPRRARAPRFTDRCVAR
jgi:hypothetical protein